MSKLNVKLAVTDQQRTKYKNMISNYTNFFKGNQGSFLGFKKTYTPREGTVDDPSKRGIRIVTTTVAEKFDYFIEEVSDFVQNLFDVELTNSTGTAMADLVVDGVVWGTFTSLELLRLKSLIESAELGKIQEMLSNIPVRSDSEVWNESDDEDYNSRDVWETEMVKGVAKTTVKTNFILEDPNLKNMKDTSNYTPVTSQRNDLLELGDYTSQNFSGEWSQRQRAMALKRRDTLLSAVIEALKVANDVESMKSTLTADKIFGYILNGE